MSIPSGIFSAQELIEDENGDLVPASRPIGTIKVGMVSWLVNMKTPEYPEGREVIFFANDVTVQSGSFGVDEDEHYLKASKLARASSIHSSVVEFRTEGCFRLLCIAPLCRSC